MTPPKSTIGQSCNDRREASVALVAPGTQQFSRLSRCPCTKVKTVPIARLCHSALDSNKFRLLTKQPLGVCVPSGWEIKGFIWFDEYMCQATQIRFCPFIIV
ncbi:hypothetical protein Btru_021239 [Bulinus truncatus]|nr:hypothetical protein Btru_021239 [Bulinus truncatus]